MALGPQPPGEAGGRLRLPGPLHCGSVPTRIQPDLSSYATENQCPSSPFFQLSDISPPAGGQGGWGGVGCDLRRPGRARAANRPWEGTAKAALQPHSHLSLGAPGEVGKAGVHSRVCQLGTLPGETLEGWGGVGWQRMPGSWRPTQGCVSFPPPR